LTEQAVKNSPNNKNVRIKPSIVFFFILLVPNYVIALSLSYFSHCKYISFFDICC